jgi:hypothetical protein
LAISTRARLFRDKDEINTEGCLGLLWIDLGDQRTVSRRGDAHVDVRWPTRIASWEVRGVLVATVGADPLRGAMCVVVVAMWVRGPPLEEHSLKRIAIFRRTYEA